MPILYDSLNLNREILLDLPFREGTGTITQDIAKPHHLVSLINTPTWTNLDSGLGVLQFNGTNEYLESDNLDTADLDFTDGDYSIGAWIYWQVGEDSQIVIGRYQLNTNGWELYLYSSGILTLRHHHAAGATQRTACYSLGWTYNTWLFMGISRIGGGDAIHYRNGIAIDMICSVGGLIDPESNNNDLVIGVRTTKDTNYFKGQMWRPRLWNRILSPDEWLTIYELEKQWFI